MVEVEWLYRESKLCVCVCVCGGGEERLDKYLLDELLL